MIGTFLLYRLKSLWFNRFKFGFWMLHLLLLVIALIYAWATASFFRITDSSEWELFKREDLVTAIGAILALLTCLRLFIPQYQPLFSPFPHHWPVSPWQRYVVSVLHDFQQRYFFYVILWIVFTLSMYPGISWFAGLFWLGCLFGAHFLMRLIQYGLDFRYKRKNGLTGAYVISALLIMGLFGLRSKGFLLNFGTWAAGVLWFALGYFLSIQPKERRPAARKGSWFHSWVAFKALLFNKKARFLLLMAVVLKTVVLAATVWFSYSKGKSVLDSQFFYWIFFSPLIFTTYVFNNTWGFWRMNWITIYLRSGEVKDFVKEYFRLFQVPLILDVLITSVAILAMPTDQVLMLVYYLTASLVILPLSLVSSFWVPKKVESSFQMQGGTSQLMALVMLFLIGVLTTIQLNYWFYILIPLYLGISLVILLNLKNLVRNQRHAIFKELFT